MALRFIDSFDHYTVLAQKWSNQNNIIVQGQGRRATAALDAAPISGYFTRKLLGAQPTWIVSYALRWKSAGTGVLCYFGDAGADQLSLHINANGTLAVRRLNTTLGTSGFALVTDEWYCLEFKATFHGATGSFEVRVDGINRLSASNVGTQNTANPSADTIGFGARFDNQVAANVYVDDVCCCDATGTANNDFLGPLLRVDAYRPNNTGLASQLIGSDADSVDNYLLVDEAAPNSDTDYVQSDVVNARDTYAFADVSHNPATIFGVQQSMFARKDDAGYRAIASVVRSGGAVYDGDSNDLLSTYTYYTDVHATNPATGLPWTQAEINAAEFGPKVAG